MKLHEIKSDGLRLYNIARAVGQREFGHSHSGLVMASFNGITHKTVTDEDAIDTYGWVFYPSNPDKFVDYSDSDLMEVNPDVDGLIYSADSDGNIFIWTGGKKRTGTLHNPLEAELKSFNRKIVNGWYVEHVESTIKDADYDGGQKAGTVIIYLVKGATGPKAQSRDDVKMRIIVYFDMTFDVNVHTFKTSHITADKLHADSGTDFSVDKFKLICADLNTKIK